jgi:hypothetical protein
MQMYANNTAIGQWDSAGMNWYKLPKVNGVNVSLSNHSHSYLPLTGGSLTGNITITTDSTIIWSRNTDYGKIYFKNTSDGDTDSYLGFESGDNGNEYFKFLGNAGGTITEWLSIKSDAVRFKGNTVYHTGNFNPSNKVDVSTYNLDMGNIAALLDDINGTII